MPAPVRPLLIGSHQIWPPLVLAPMSGVTNRTMRGLYKPFGLGLTVTEFVSANALKFGSKRTMEMIDQHGLEKPVSTQLWGDDPQTMAMAAKVVRECGADIVDINFGCPAPKVVKTNGGSACLRDIDRCEAIMDAVVKAVDCPDRVAGGRTQEEANSDARSYLLAIEKAPQLSFAEIDVASIRALHAAVISADAPTPIRVTSVAMRANVPGARLRLSGAVPGDVIPRLEALQQGIFANSKLGRFEKIALGYFEIVRTHPFDDGNGRLSRLLLSLMVASEFKSGALIGITHVMRTNFPRYHAVIRNQGVTVYAEWMAYIIGAMKAELHAAGRFDASLQTLEQEERDLLLRLSDETLSVARQGGSIEFSDLRRQLPNRSGRLLAGLFS